MASTSTSGFTRHRDAWIVVCFTPRFFRQHDGARARNRLSYDLRHSLKLPVRAAQKARSCPGG